MKKYYIGPDEAFKTANGLEEIPLSSILEFQSVTEDTVFLVEGEDNLVKIREWNNKNIVHFGLRNNRVTLNQLESLPYLSIGKNIRIYLSCFKSTLEIKRELFLNCEDLKSKIKYPDTHIVSVTDSQECLKWIQYFSKGKDLLGIDFEAAGNNRGFPNIKHFLPLGMAVSDKNNAVYFDFGNYDKTKYFKIYGTLMEFVKTNAWRLYAFYCVYEMGALWHITDNLSAASKGEIIDIQDTMAWCRVDGSLESLKFNAQKYLGIGSWDEEVEDFISKLDPYFKKYPTFEELQLSPDYHTVLNLLDEYESSLDRLKEFYGSAWAVVPVHTMGYYCCLDAFMDILLVEEIRPRHAKRVAELNAETLDRNICRFDDKVLDNFPIESIPDLYDSVVGVDDAYEMQLQSLHLKARMEMQCIIPVDANLLLKMKDYYEILMHNSHLLSCYQMAKLEFRYIKLNYEKLCKKYKRNKMLEEYVKHYPAKKMFFMLPSKSARLKSFLLPFIENGVFNFERLYYYLSDGGKNLTEELKFEIDETFKKYVGWTGGKVKMGYREANAIYDYLDSTMRLQESLDSLVEHYNKIFETQLRANNVEIMKQWNGKPKVIVDCALAGKFPRAQFPKTKFVNDAKLYYVVGGKYEVMPNHITQIILNSILNYDNMKDFIAELKAHVTDRTLTSAPTAECEKFKRYDFNSDPNMKTYGKWLKSMYLKDVLDAIEFVSKYKNHTKGNFVSNQCTWEVYERIVDQMNGFYGDNDLVKNITKEPWTPVKLHKDLCEKQLALAAQCFREHVPVILTTESKLIEIDKTPELPLFELDAMIKSIRLYKRTHHALSNTFKTIRDNTFEIDADWTNPDFKFYRDSKPVKLTPKSKNIYFVPPMKEKGTRTGRFSGGIQTIGDVDMKMALKVMPGCIICSKDISAAEPRTIAKFSGDRMLYQLYNTPGADGYRNMAIACRPFLLKESPEVVKEHRNEFKQNFLAVVYGATVQALSRRARISLSVASQVIDTLYKTYPDMRIWMDKCVEYATKYRRVKTFFGEIVPLTSKSNPKTVGVNSVIQSTAAKILNAGYVSVAKIFSKLKIYFRGILQIHDAFYEEILLSDLFNLTLIFDVGFYQMIKDKYDLNYEYEMELRYNYKDKIKFEFKYDENFKNIEFTLEGFSFHVDYVLNAIKKQYNVKITKSGTKDYVSPDKIAEFFKGKENRGHDFFTHDMAASVPLKKKKVSCTCQVNLEEFAKLVKEQIA